jgi:hypothetical protein
VAEGLGEAPDGRASSSCLSSHRLRRFGDIGSGPFGLLYLPETDNNGHEVCEDL